MPLLKTTFEHQGAVARIALNRPDKRNALSRKLIQELRTVIASVQSDDMVRLVVLTAEGPAFCAGMDLHEMRQRSQDVDPIGQWQADTQGYRDLLVDLISLPIPTLAVVQGPALAGGLGLVLTCDMVLVSQEAKFGLPEPKRGLTAAVVSPLLVHRVGHARAGYVLFSGKTIPSDEALAVGLCQEVSPPEDLANAESRLVESILTGARSSLIATKRVVYQNCLPRLILELDVGMRASAEARHSDDAQEGLASFFEKRNPNWFPGDS